MSYEIYITRIRENPPSVHFLEWEGPLICVEEWEGLLAANSDLSIVYSNRLTEAELEFLVRQNPEFADTQTFYGYSFSESQSARLEELATILKRGVPLDLNQVKIDTARWLAHPRGEERHFWYEPEAISTKDPDLATIHRMFQLAEGLDACVRGDDEEFYRRSGRRIKCREVGGPWSSLEEYHRWRPEWAPGLMRELARLDPLDKTC